MTAQDTILEAVGCDKKRLEQIDRICNGFGIELTAVDVQIAIESDSNDIGYQIIHRLYHAVRSKAEREYIKDLPFGIIAYTGPNYTEICVIETNSQKETPFRNWDELKNILFGW